MTHKDEVESRPVLNAFRRGEAWAFELIHGRFHAPILSWIRDRTRDPEAAEDLTQEIFLKVHRARGSFDPSKRLSSWIWAIARNTWMDWGRAQTRQGLKIVEESDPDSVPCPGPDAERLLERKSIRRLLFQKLKGLTAQQKRVLWLSVVRQLPYSEIARRLGISLTAVKCLAYRSRLVLLQAGLVAYV